MNIKIVIKLLLFGVFFTAFSCKVHNYHDDMKKCINKNYIIMERNINFSGVALRIKDDFDLFIKIKKFENLLIEQHLLTDNSKESYKRIIKQNVDSVIKIKILETVKNKNPYLYSLPKHGAIYIGTFYNSCPYDIVKTKKGALAYYSTKAVFEDIIQDGNVNDTHLLALANVTDFDDETSRLILCNLLFANWYWEINTCNPTK